MNRKPSFANVFFSVLIGLTLIFSAARPINVSAATENKQSPAIVSADSASLKEKGVITLPVVAESAPVNAPESVVAEKPADVPLQTGIWPVYFEMVVDDARGWIYGSDSDGNKIDVIRISDLQLEKSIPLASGASPRGMALSPDGSELAVAQYFAGTIFFLNLITEEKITVIPQEEHATYTPRPWDVIYGRDGRLYSSGSPSNHPNAIHVYDTSTHTWLARTPFPGSTWRSAYLAISSDKNTLYVNDWNDKILKIDVSTDTIPAPVITTASSDNKDRIVLSPDDNVLFSGDGVAWDPELRASIGAILPNNYSDEEFLTILPGRDAVAIAIDDFSNLHDRVVFASASTLFVLSIYEIGNMGTIGSITATSDGTKLIVSTSTGLISINLTAFPPGTAQPLPTGSMAYHDLVADEARQVLYGSNPTGHRVDIISMVTSEVVGNIWFKNGTSPKGMDIDLNGNELAVALSEGGMIAFINLDTKTITHTIFPDTRFPGVLDQYEDNKPYDVIYGRLGRLYSSGTPYSFGSDYIHVINTDTHQEVSKSNYVIRAGPYLAISSDKNTLYVNDDKWFSPQHLYKFDVSTDTLSDPVESPHADWLKGDKFLLSVDNNQIYMDSGMVWDASLIGQIGGTGQKGNLALLPTHNAIATGVDTTTTDSVLFSNANNYYGIKKYTLPIAGTLGAMISASDGSKLFISSDKGMMKIDLSGGLPGTAVPAPDGKLPYYDMVIDEARGVLYGSDPTGHKIDVISVSTLTIIKKYRLVNGATPLGIDLSPDGSELAIAQNGASSLIFLNPDTGAMIARIYTDTTEAAAPWEIGGYNVPYDVIYGRLGRLYSTGAPNVLGVDYLHIIDTTTHTEIVKSDFYVRSFNALGMSSDNNTLYVNLASQSPQKILQIDVSTDTLPDPSGSPFANGVTGKNFALTPDDSKLFMDSGQAWNSELTGKLGSTGLSGYLAILPTHNVIAMTADGTDSDAVAFFSLSDYFGVKAYTLPVAGTLGPMVVKSNDSKIFLSTSAGVVSIDLSAGLPGNVIPLPVGMLPYFDMIADEARGVLYGSDSMGHKIDVISMTSLQVIDKYYLVNGATPTGIALSPDGSELAVAQYGASTIVFLNPETGDQIASIRPNNAGDKGPYDVIYGRAGRLYSTDSIHVYDTSTHAEIGMINGPGSYPSMAISADGNTLYIIQTHQSPEYLYRVDVSTDLPVFINHTTMDFSYDIATFSLMESVGKILVSSGKVFSSDLSTNLGSFTPRGRVTEIPSQDAFLSTSGNRITFFDLTTYQQVGYILLNGVSSSGVAVIKSDDSILFVTTDVGIKAVDLSVFPPLPPDPPAAFNKFAPANGATNQSITPTLSWQPNDGATFEYCYDTTNDNACASWIDNGTVTSVSLSGLSPDTTYYWQVRASNQSGTVYANGSGTAFWSFKTASLPGAFNKMLPANLALKQPIGPLLKWGASTGATSYEYCYDTYNDSFCNTTWNSTVGTSVNLSGLINNATYYWQVRAIGPGGKTYSNTNAWWSFKIAMPPPNTTSPGNLVPGVADNIYTRRPTFTWDAVPGATSYTVEASTMLTFSTKAINASASTNIYVRTMDLAASTVYYWRVKANGTNGPSAYSQVRTFTTGNPPPAPALSIPASNALLTDYTPTFDWSDTAPAGGHYELQLATDSAFTLNVVNINNIPASNYTPLADLASNTKFYWRARAYNAAADASAWTTSRYFRTALLPPVTQTPGVNVPTLAPNLHTRRPTLTWDAVPGATTYTVEVSTAITFATKAVNATTSATSYTPTLDLAANTTFYWRVKANGTNGPSLYSSPLKTFSTGNPPSVPTLAAPAANALLTSATPLLNWNNSTVPAGAPVFHEYEVQVASDSLFNSVVETVHVSGIANSETVTPALLNGATYYWRVRSVNVGADAIGGNTDDDFSGWSLSRSFRIAYAAPILNLPLDGAINVVLKPTFTWTAIPGAASYNLQVSKTDTFAVLIVTKTINAPVTSYVHTLNLVANTKYYWRVRANGAYGPGFWQFPVFSFTTAP